MKRLTLLTFSYQPETTALAKRATAMAEMLTSDGWDVTVITQVAEPSASGETEQDQAGYPHVVRLRPWNVSKSNLPLRLLAELYFALRCVLRARKIGADIVFSTSPYMFLGPAGWLAARLRSAKHVWEVRDLTWRYPAAAGKSTFGVDRMLEWLMFWTSRHADALVTTTRGQFSYFEAKKGKPQAGWVVPNGVSATFLERLAGPLEEIKKSEKPTVVYAGVLGFAQGLSAVIGAARYLPEVSFLLVGDGPQREGLERMVEEQHIHNVTFTGYVGVDEVIEYYLRAHVLVAHLRSDPVFEITQPSKIWEYMATGRPVVYGGAGEAAEAVAESGGGLVSPPDDPEAMAERISELLSDPGKAERMGEEGRALVLRHKRRETALSMLAENMEGLLA